MKITNYSIISLSILIIIALSFPTLAQAFLIIDPGDGGGTSRPSTPTLNQPATPEYDGIITLSWSKSSTASYYYVYRCNSYLKTGSYSYIGKTTRLSFVDTAPEGFHWYKVRARNSAGYSGYSNTVSVRVTMPHLSLRSENPTRDDNIIVSWSYCDCDNYELFRDINGLGFTKIANPDWCSGLWVDDGFHTTGTIRYKLRAYSSSVGYSSFSNIISVDVNPISRPSNLIGDKSVITNPNVELILQWDAVPEANKYFIYEKKDFNLNSGYSLAYETTSNSFLITNIDSYTKRYYCVTAINNNGESQSSNAIYVEGNLPPAAPSGLWSYVGSDYIKVSWGAIFGATSYEIWQKIGTYNWIYLGTTSLTHYYDYSVQPSHPYYYEVKSINQYGESDFSPYTLIFYL
jgi:fibronectin type 3 domain-containing protein